MSDNTYNGWTNRETWLVNLYFMDSVDIEESVEADYLETMVDEYLEAFSLPPFVTDLMALGLINWQELADTHNSDLED